MVRNSVGRKNAKQDGASVAVLESDKSKSCMFCNSAIDDEVLYGNIYTIGSITCHYFCVLLSCCMAQSGSDDEGLFGFLEHDILTELKRGKRLKCCYCKRNGATLACCSSICRKQFHLNCGRQNGVTSLFFGNFQSFCPKHTVAQALPDELQHRVDDRMRCLQRKQNSANQAASLKASEEKQGSVNTDVNEAVQSDSNAQIVCEKEFPIAAEDISALTADISNANLLCDEQNQNGRANGDDVTDISAGHCTRSAADKRRGDPKKFEKAENPERRLPIRSCKNSTPTTQSKTKDAASKKASSTPEVRRGIIHHETECECNAYACPMCYESVQAFPSIESLWPPCCATDIWLHRYCVQRMALNAGMHYLKCPLCNDREVFCAMVKKQGIYVPDRDAAWELETGAFAELQERHALCDAAECRCTRGRGYNTQKGSWELMLCTCCGSQGCHSHCLPPPSKQFICNDCKVFAPEQINAEQVSPSTSSERDRQRPVMPSRMSLGRTKHKSPRPCRKNLDESDEFSDEVILNVSPLKMQKDLQESESDVEIEIIDSDSNGPTIFESVQEQARRLAMQMAGRHLPEYSRLMEKVKPGPKSAKMRILEKLIQKEELAKMEKKQSVESLLQNYESSNTESPATKIDSGRTSIDVEQKNDYSLLHQKPSTTESPATKIDSGITSINVEQKNEHSLLRKLLEEKSEPSPPRNLSADLTQNCTLSISTQSEKSDDIHIAVLELDQDENFVGYVSKKVNLTQSEHQNCNTEIQKSTEAGTRSKSFAEWLTKSEEAMLDKNASTPKTGPDNKLPNAESVSDLSGDKPIPKEMEKFEYYYLREVEPSSRKGKERASATETANSRTSLEMKISETLEDSNQGSSSESEVEIYENVPEFTSASDNVKIEYRETKVRLSTEEICIDIKATDCILDISSESSADNGEEIRVESDYMEASENTEEIECRENDSTDEREPEGNSIMKVNVGSSEKEVNDIIILESNSESESQIRNQTISQSLVAESLVDSNSKECLKDAVPNNEGGCREIGEESLNRIVGTKKNEGQVETNNAVTDGATEVEVHESYLQDISSESEIEVIIKKRSVSPAVKKQSDSEEAIFARKVKTELFESDDDVIFHSQKKRELEHLSISSITEDSEEHLIDEIISKELTKKSKNHMYQYKSRKAEKGERTTSHDNFNSDTEDEDRAVKSRTKYPRSCNTRWNMEISSCQDKICLKINNRNENMDFVYGKESSQEDNFDISIDRNQRHSNRSLSRSNVKAYRRKNARNRRQNARHRRRVHSLVNEKDTWSSSKRKVDLKTDRSFEDYPQMCRGQNEEIPNTYYNRHNDRSERPPRKKYEQFNNHWSKSKESSQAHGSDRSYRKDSRSNKEYYDVNSQGWFESEEKYKSHVKTKNLDLYSSQVSTSRHLIENQSWKQKKDEKEMHEVWSSMPYRTYAKLSKADRDLRACDTSYTRKRRNETPGHNVESKRIKIKIENDTESPDTNYRTVYRQSILDISPESGRAEDMIVRTKEDVLMTPILKKRRKVVIKSEDGKKQTDIMRFFHRL